MAYSEFDTPDTRRFEPQSAIDVVTTLVPGANFLQMLSDVARGMGGFLLGSLGTYKGDESK